MKRTLKQRATVLPAVAASLAIGILIGWLLRSWGPPRPVVLDADPTQPEIAAPAISSTGLTKTSGAREVAATTGEPLVAPASPTSLPIAGAIDALRGRDLRLPIDGANVDAMKDSGTAVTSGAWRCSTSERGISDSARARIAGDRRALPARAATFLATYL